MNPADKNFSIFKTDDDKRLVFGWASVAITVNGEQLEDRQQDIIDPEDLEEAAYEYVLNFRDTGEEHNPTMRKKGKLVESCVLTAEKQKAMGIPEGSVPVGWWIGFKIEDDAAWERVKSGQYRMFSIEGKANREPVEKSRSSYDEYPSYSMWLEENLDATIEQQKAAKAYYETHKEEAKRNWKWNPDPVAKTFDDVLKFNENHDRLGRFATSSGGGAGTGGGPLMPDSFKKTGSGDFEITEDVQDMYFTDTARKKITDATARVRTAEDLKDYLAGKGIDMEIKSSALLERKSEEIPAVKKQIDYVIAAVEQYGEIGGLQSVKKINFFDPDLETAGQYIYRAIGESTPADNGNIYLSNRANGFQIMHEFAHAWADSTKPSGEDAVTWSEKLNKKCNLDQNAKAYFGAPTDVLEAEKFANEIGGAFSFGKPRKLEFLTNVANEIQSHKTDAKKSLYANQPSVAKTFSDILKFNPYHDSHGRFASVNSYTRFSANQNTTAGRMAIERHSRNSNNSRITNINPAANKQRVIDQWKETQDFQDYQAKLQTDVQHCYRINSSIAQKIVNTQHADITSTDLDALTPHFKDGPMKLPNGDNNTSGYFQSKNSMRINQKIRENVKDGKSWDDGFDLDDQKTIAAMEKGMKPLSKGLQLRRNVNDSCMEGCGISAKDIQDAISDPSNIKNISNKLLGEWGVCANYQSTGYDFGDTSSFSNRSVSLVINAPKGTKAFVSPTMMESEVVLARNTKIRYTGNVSVETRMDGTKYLAVEAVVDKDFN